MLERKGYECRKGQTGIGKGVGTFIYKGRINCITHSLARQHFFSSDYNWQLIRQSGKIVICLRLPFCTALTHTHARVTTPFPPPPPANKNIKAALVSRGVQFSPFVDDYKAKFACYCLVFSYKRQFRRAVRSRWFIFSQFSLSFYSVFTRGRLIAVIVFARALL